MKILIQYLVIVIQIFYTTYEIKKIMIMKKKKKTFNKMYVPNSKLLAAFI